MWPVERQLECVPADVIYSFMTNLHLRIRQADHRITVITADRREWVLKSG